MTKSNEKSNKKSGDEKPSKTPILELINEASTTVQQRLEVQVKSTSKKLRTRK